MLPGLAVRDLLSSPYALFGTVAQIAEQLQRRRSELGVTYLTVFEKDLDAMAQVIELLHVPACCTDALPEATLVDVR